MVVNLPWQEFKRKGLVLPGTDPGFIQKLDALDDYSGGKFWIHRLTDPNARKRSQHRNGKAGDGHILNMSLLDMWVMIERFGFKGVGLYGPDVWNNPGFHVDDRNKNIGAKWGQWKNPQTGRREYTALNEGFIQHLAGDSKYLI